MKPTTPLGISAMPLCVPVVFNRTHLQKGWHAPPSVVFTKNTTPWTLIGIRAVLMMTAALCVWLETSFLPNGGPLVFFQTILILSDWTFLFLVIPSNYKGFYDEKAFLHALFFFLRSFCAVFFIIISFLTSQSSPIYSTATIGAIVIEIIMLVRNKKHYNKLIKEAEDNLIPDVERIVGVDNCVSKPISTHFKTSYWFPITEEMIWEGVPRESRGERSRTTGGIMKNKKAKTLFISWDSYTTLRDKMNTDLKEIRLLTKKNSDLRTELERYNDKICKLRFKIYGSKTDCSDIAEIPVSPPPLDPWSHENAEGLFVLSKGEITAYVKVTSYRELAVQATVVKRSIVPLKREKILLKQELQKRISMIEGLVEIIIEEEEKEEIYQKDECVRIQIE